MSVFGSIDLIFQTDLTIYTNLTIHEVQKICRFPHLQLKFLRMCVLFFRKQEREI